MPDRQATEVGPDALMRGYRSPYFEIETGGSLLFTAPVGGGLTATAKYTRSELREMLDPADKARNWALQGRHTMSLRQEVVQAPRSGRVVVFQIHAIQPDGGAAPPLVKAQWRDDKMQFLVKAQATGGKDIVYEVPDVPLNKAYDAGLRGRRRPLDDAHQRHDPHRRLRGQRPGLAVPALLLQGRQLPAGQGGRRRAQCLGGAHPRAEGVP